MNVADLTHADLLTVEEVLDIHAAVMQRAGRAPQHADPDRLASAVQSAHGRLDYEHEGPPPLDLFDYAATYLHRIAESQAFLDGNKRTALAAALTFLGLHGVGMPEETEAMVEAVERFAAQPDGAPRWTTDDGAAWLRGLHRD